MWVPFTMNNATIAPDGPGIFELTAQGPDEAVASLTSPAAIITPGCDRWCFCARFASRNPVNDSIFVVGLANSTGEKVGSFLAFGDFGFPDFLFAMADDPCSAAFFADTGIPVVPNQFHEFRVCGTGGQIPTIDTILIDGAPPPMPIIVPPGDPAIPRDALKAWIEVASTSNDKADLLVDSYCAVWKTQTPCFSPCIP